MRYSFFLVFLLSLYGCAEKSDALNAEQIIERSIAAQGGKILDNAKLSFDFRGKLFTATREDGAFSLERCSDLKCKDTVDMLTNSDITRTIDGNMVSLPDSLKTRIDNQVNSVHYFAILPYGLDNAVVKKELIDTVTVSGNPYYKIKVHFEEEGGGTDYEDEYMYWVNRENFYVDYLAYNFQVNEGGTRFREAYNQREIHGVRFVDYRNYVPEEQYPPLESLDSLFENRKMELLSVIELKNIKVDRCPDCE